MTIGSDIFNSFNLSDNGADSEYLAVYRLLKESMDTGPEAWGDYMAQAPVVYARAVLDNVRVAASQMINRLESLPEDYGIEPAA